MKFHRLVLALVVAACLFGIYGCKSFSSDGFPVIATMDARTDGAYPIVGRTDGRTYLFRADADVTLRLVDKASGVPLVLYQVQAGKVALISKPRDFKRSYETDEPLPLWVLQLFPDGGRAMAEAMGFVVEADPVPPPNP